MFRGNRGKRRYTVRRSFKSANQFMGQAIPGNDIGDFELTGERTEPVAQMSLLGDYVWPVAVSFTIALLGSILTYLVVKEFEYTFTFRQVMIEFVALALLSFLLSVRHIFSLKWVKEVIDEFLPEPEPVPVIELTVNVKDKRNKVVTMHRPQLTCSSEQLLEFTSGVLKARKSLAVKTWAGKNKPFSRDQYDRFMISCERSGLVVKVGNGRELTEQGEQVFEEIWGKRQELLNPPTLSE